MSILFDHNEDPTKLSKSRLPRTIGNIKSETAKKYDNLLVFGYGCKLFRDDETAAKVNNGENLIPWMGNKEIMIDRYDGRGHLHSVSEFDFRSLKFVASPVETHIERICNEERYMDLSKDMIEEDILREEDAKRSKALYDQNSAYQAIRMTYKDENNAGKSLSDISSGNDAFLQYCQYYGYSVKDDAVKKYFLQMLSQGHNYDYNRPPPPPDPPAPAKFRAPDGLVIPKDMQVPETGKMQSILEKTALFISQQGVQMEIVLKTKQAGNAQFEFLNFGNWLNPYYKFILKKIKDKEYTPDSVEETYPKKSSPSDKEDSSDSDSEDLHPLLQAHRRPILKTPAAYVPKTKHTGKIEDLAKVYMSMKYKQEEDPSTSGIQVPPTTTPTQAHSQETENLPNLDTDRQPHSLPPVPTWQPPTTPVPFPPPTNLPRHLHARLPGPSLPTKTVLPLNDDNGENILPPGVDQEESCLPPPPPLPPPPSIETVLREQSIETSTGATTSADNFQYSHPDVVQSATRYTPSPLLSKILNTTNSENLPSTPYYNEQSYEATCDDNLPSSTEPAYDDHGCFNDVSHLPDQYTSMASEHPAAKELVQPPTDLQSVIDRLALYVAKNGEEFEEGIKTKKDPRFDFLNSWSIYHPYYLKQKVAQKELLAKLKQEDEERRKNLKVSFGLKNKSKGNVVGKVRTTDVFNVDDDEVHNESAPCRDVEIKTAKEEENRPKVQSKKALVTPQHLAHAKRMNQAVTIKEAQKARGSEERKRKQSSQTNDEKRSNKRLSNGGPPAKKQVAKKDAFFEAINQAFGGK